MCNKCICDLLGRERKMHILLLAYVILATTIERKYLDKDGFDYIHNNQDNIIIDDSCILSAITT